MPTTITAVDEDLATVRAETSPAAFAFSAATRADAEFDRQVRTYVEVGFPSLVGLDGLQFAAALEPLRAQLSGLDAAGIGAIDVDDHVPFVLVVHPDRYDLNDAVPAMRRGRVRGVSVIDRDEAATYGPIEGVRVPDGFAYLLRDLDTGGELRNVRPEEALAVVLGRGRTPLTIGEGLALVIVRPDMLRPNRCFSLLASRTTNQRVPAIWISERRPKLGWCWDRNPHTWLGSASARDRVASTPALAPGLPQVAPRMAD